MNSLPQEILRALDKYQKEVAVPEENPLQELEQFVKMVGNKISDHLVFLLRTDIILACGMKLNPQAKQLSLFLNFVTQKELSEGQKVFIKNVFVDYFPPEEPFAKTVVCFNLTMELFENEMRGV